MEKTETVSTKQYYNAIAAEYNEHVSKPKDIAVRNEVAYFFINNATGKKVLDFGGGTGLDLPWLIENKYQVFFCEPAEKMRTYAFLLSDNYEAAMRPVFVDKTDFRLWSETQRPFDEKINAILANFGVLNYIDDLPLLFNKFSDLLVEDGCVIANILDSRPGKLFGKYFRNTVKAILYGDRIKTGSQYQGLRHEAILYSISEIERASQKHFVLKKSIKLGKRSDFLLLYLQKK